MADMTDDEIVAEIDYMERHMSLSTRSARRVKDAIQRRKPAPTTTTAASASGAKATLISATPLPPPTPSGVPQVSFVGPCDAGRIQVFGMAFHAGYIPADSGADIYDAADNLLFTQLDVVSTHPDGSARFASMAVRLPDLAAGQRLNCRIDRGVKVGGATSLNFNDHTVTVEAFGQMFFPFIPSGIQRLSGPLVVEDEVTLPVTIGTIKSARLIFDRRVTADGRISIDLETANDSMDWPDTAAKTLPSYRLKVVMDGVTQIDRTISNHGCYTAFSRLFGDAGDACTVVHDLDYLADHGFLPRFDRRLGVSPRVLTTYENMPTHPDWNEPWNPRGLNPYMPNVGGRPEIGIVTDAQATWLITSDPRAKRVAEDQARALSGAPWRYHDRKAGEWASPRHRPTLWADNRDKNWKPTAVTKPWTPDTSHPACGFYVPALLTARRAFLRGLEAQATYCIMAQKPGDTDLPGTRSVHRWNQVRATAWCQRTIQRAAVLLGGEWVKVTESNYADLFIRALAMTDRQGEPHGWTSGTGERIGPWQEDFVSAVVEEGAALGYTDALKVLDIRDNWIIGRFLARPGWIPILGLGYYLEAGPVPGENAVCYQTWADLSAANVVAASNAVVETKNPEYEYTLFAEALLARMQDRLGAAHPGLAEARAFVKTLLTHANGYLNNPRMSVVARGETRA